MRGREATPSSDSDFKKSMEFEKDNSINPDSNSDKHLQNSHSKKMPKLKLEQIKLEFPDDMIRRVGDGPSMDGQGPNRRNLYET